MKELNKPHDKFFKSVFSHPEHARDLVVDTAAAVEVYALYMAIRAGPESNDEETTPYHPVGILSW
jgi:predicted transposase YdaD